MKMQASPVLSLSPSSPSFSTCSSGRLAEIAARVVEEFRQDSQDDTFDEWTQVRQQLQEEEQKDEDVQEQDQDFEFAFVCREAEYSSPISADEIFQNGRIKPIYPLFDTTLLAAATEHTQQRHKSHRLPLRKLFSEERETPSCSSSEADELESAAPGSYCVWVPKAENQESPGRCKKSNSTGSSKRWKLRDLLYRSSSDGKDTYMFLSQSRREKATNDTAESYKEAETGSRRLKGVEEHYVRNRAVKEGDKRKSYLPYRQDLVGILSNANGFSRNLHPF